MKVRLGIHMEGFLTFVKNWGYVAVFLGSLVEGESVILTASSLAYFGHLNLYKIMAIAFTGTVIADQALFMLGRKYGEQFFDKYPKFRVPADRASRLLHRFDMWFILTFRFIYGIRIVSPIVIGSLGVSPSRFVPLNLIAAALWTLVSCVSGYYFGDFIFRILQNIHTVMMYMLVAGGILGIYFGIRWYVKRKSSSTLKIDEDS